ncbi:outer membrane beta-barrel protein [Roseateles albus]|uniref:Outer membrane beta-barrel protein n=1 Tax=Roseateles albus TaxID=2987525 RepID=A0ABT5K9P7_9BURK|nr:outer membrane beta-barrel protein [Roseateles albus]MDC8770284.1 outer membrane beta-barrel protein [Roseateles albus]
MKKLITAVTTTLACLTALGGSGQAQAAEQGFYVGGDIGRSSNNLKSPTKPAVSTDKTATSWGLYGGYQFNKYFATELGVTRLGSTHIGTGESTSTSYSLDAIGRLPLNDKFAFYGRLGAAHNERSYSGFDKNHAVGFKTGLGMEYALDKNWALRTELTRFNNMPTQSTYGNASNVLSMGVNYHF